MKEEETLTKEQKLRYELVKLMIENKNITFPKTSQPKKEINDYVDFILQGTAEKQGSTE